MDYSQFGAMRPELILLGIFLIVFLFDTFAGEKARKATTPLTLVLFGLGTVAMWILPDSFEGSVFGGMYVSTHTCVWIKNILNVGAFIVLLQSVKWIESPDDIVRKGEFYELLRHVSDDFGAPFPALRDRS